MGEAPDKAWREGVGLAIDGKARTGNYGVDRGGFPRRLLVLENAAEIEDEDEDENEDDLPGETGGC
jgi:hypothetical protein